MIGGAKLLSLVKGVKDFQGVQKALQEIEDSINGLSESTNVASEGEVTDIEGKTGDIRITQNEDKDYIFEVRAEDGWKTPVIGDTAVKFKEKPSSSAAEKKESIDEIESKDTSTADKAAEKTIFDEKAGKFVLPRPDYDSGWVAADNNVTTVLTHNLDLKNEPSMYTMFISEVESPAIGTNNLIGAFTIDGNRGVYVDFYSADVANVHVGDSQLFHHGSFGDTNVPDIITDGFIRLRIWK